MSPAPMGRRPSRVVTVSPAAMRAASSVARRWARITCGALGAGLSTGSNQSPSSSRSGGGTTGQRSTRPGFSVWNGRWTTSPQARVVDAGEDVVHRRQDRGRGAEREFQRPAVEARPAREAVCRNGRASGRTPRGRRPGTSRSTASCRRRRRSCGKRRRGRRARRRTRSRDARSPTIARGRCPGPRPPGCGRSRRRAGRAPSPPAPRRSSRPRALRIRSSKSSQPRACLAAV